jgi:hypothetical protein
METISRAETKYSRHRKVVKKIVGENMKIIFQGKLAGIMERFDGWFCKPPLFKQDTRRPIPCARPGKLRVRHRFVIEAHEHRRDRGRLFGIFCMTKKQFTYPKQRRSRFETYTWAS